MTGKKKMFPYWKEVENRARAYARWYIPNLRGCTFIRSEGLDDEHGEYIEVAVHSKKLGDKLVWIEL